MMRGKDDSQVMILIARPLGEYFKMVRKIFESMTDFGNCFFHFRSGVPQLSSNC